MEKKHCEYEECKNYWSCKYLKHRFHTTACKYNEVQVLIVHDLELKERRKMLKQLNKPR